jgi:RNA polymerase sigma factor (sigma-70 family)
MQDDRYYIELILKGDSTAFNVIVDRYKSRVYTFTLRMVRVPEDAEEIAHDAFVKAYAALPLFKFHCKFSTWIYRIAYNESISFIRRKKLNTVSIDGSMIHGFEKLDNPNILNELGEREKQIWVRNALERLPEDERSIVTLYYYQECSVKEISEITGSSASNVKIKLFRARKRLLLYLGNLKESLMTNQYGT